MNNSDLEITHQKAKVILLAEGFASVSLQVFIMRQLVPFAGSNVIISSLVIGIFLAFLALGYHTGGSRTKNQLKTLKNNMIYSAILISIGFSYLFMELFFILSKDIIGNTMIEITIYLLLFLAPPVFLLGQTMPLLTNFMKEQRVSETTGLALSVNTIGSVLGSIVTSLIFISYFGMAWTLVIDVAILCSLSIYLSDKNKRSTIIFTSTFIISLCYVVNKPIEQGKFLVTNEYANYSIKEDEKGIALILNNSHASGIDSNGMPFKYATTIRTMMTGLGIEDSDILVLGAGGFTISRGDKSNRYKYIDIDPALKRIAENYILKRRINGEVEFTDARIYLDRNEDKVDAIIVDLFTHRESMPWHVTTKEFMTKLSNTLNDDGYVFFNIISKKRFSDPFSQAIDNTITSTFNYCYKTPVFLKGTDFLNLVYACKKNGENDSKKIYIDNYSDVEIDLN